MNAIYFLFLFSSICCVYADEESYSSPEINAEEPFRTFVITIPKSGTHLIGPALHHILGKNLFNCGLIIVHPRDEQNQFLNLENKRVIVLVRDPRDVVVSMYYWIKRTHAQGETWPTAYTELIENNAPLDKFLSYIINPKDYGISVISYFDNAERWINQDALVIRYEDLIGEKGGGSKEAQLMTLKAIADFLNQDLTDEMLEEISNQIYGNTVTFRQGKIGDWKKHFTQENLDLFNQIFYSHMEKLKYPIQTDLY